MKRFLISDKYRWRYKSHMSKEALYSLSENVWHGQYQLTCNSVLSILTSPLKIFSVALESVGSFIIRILYATNRLSQLKLYVGLILLLPDNMVAILKHEHKQGPWEHHIIVNIRILNQISTYSSYQIGGVTIALPHKKLGMFQLEFKVV